jgi:hypothetical protein
MNRAFKTIYHNGEEDEKPIVTLSCTINDCKLFKDLNKQSKRELISGIEDFQKRLKAFKRKIKP